MGNSSTPDEGAVQIQVFPIWNPSWRRLPKPGRNKLHSIGEEREGENFFPKKGKIDYATTTSLLGEQTPSKKVKPEEKFVEIS